MKLVVFTKDNDTRAGILLIKELLQTQHEIHVVAKKARENLLHNIERIQLYEIEDHNSDECEVLLKNIKPDLIIIMNDVILKPKGRQQKKRNKMFRKYLTNIHDKN